VDWWIAIKPVSSNMYLYVDSTVMSSTDRDLWKGLWWSQHTVNGGNGFLKLDTHSPPTRGSYGAVNGAGAVKLTFDSIVRSATRVVYNDQQHVVVGLDSFPGPRVYPDDPYAHAKGAVGYQAADGPGGEGAAWMIHTVPYWTDSTYPSGGTSPSRQRFRRVVYIHCYITSVCVVVSL
jgi:hypothetical protein